MELAIKKTTHASEQERPDVVAKRAQWKADQPHLDIRRLIFIDETGLNTQMARRYGRSPYGERCHSSVPHSHWNTSSFIAGLRYDRITAPFIVEGSVNSAVFTTYLQEILCPELHQGDIVIMDNLSTHKIQNVEKLISSKGAILRYLPPL